MSISYQGTNSQGLERKYGHVERERGESLTISEKERRDLRTPGASINHKLEGERGELNLLGNAGEKRKKKWKKNLSDLHNLPPGAAAN